MLPVKMYPPNEVIRPLPTPCQLYSPVKTCPWSFGCVLSIMMYAFYHALWIHNALPTCCAPTISPIAKATNVIEDFLHFQTFGWCIWVRPPGRRPAKLKLNSCWGIFLGYVPYTTRNILWYYTEPTQVKITAHAKFYGGFNDLLLAAVPPNVIHLECTDTGNWMPLD